MKTAHDHMDKFLMTGCTMKDLAAAARVFVQEMAEAEAETVEEMLAVLSAQDEKWHLFAHMVNAQLERPVVDEHMFRVAVDATVLAMIAKRILELEEITPPKKSAVRVTALHWPPCPN